MQDHSFIEHYTHNLYMVNLWQNENYSDNLNLT